EIQGPGLFPLQGTVGHNRVLDGCKASVAVTHAVLSLSRIRPQSANVPVHAITSPQLQPKHVSRKGVAPKLLVMKIPSHRNTGEQPPFKISTQIGSPVIPGIYRHQVLLFIIVIYPSEITENQLLRFCTTNRYRGSRGIQGGDQV